MDIILIKAAQLILALAFLVIIHEFGHFLFARIFGVKVEKFYMFFNPWFELFKWKPKKYIGGLGKKTNLKSNSVSSPNVLNSSTQINDNCGEKEITVEDEEKSNRSFWGNTEYGIGWLPLGGYCKISGMIDESMDTEQMKKPAQKWEFRAKPAWQRLLIMIGGVLFNFLLAILIYAGIVYATGEKYISFRNAEMGMSFSPAAQKIGFVDGDIPLAADGKELDNPFEARMDIMQANNVNVLRGNDTVTIAIPDNFIFTVENEIKSGISEINFMAYRLPAVANQVIAGEGADRGGMKKGDRILAIDSVPTTSLDNFLAEIKLLSNQTVELKVERKSGAVSDTLIVPVKTSDSAKIGIGLETDPSKFFKADEIHYSLLQSLPRGVQLGTDKLVSYVKSMKYVFTKEGAKSVGGFGAIGSIFPEKWDWIAFWNIAAFLSVVLAFMNILPIPALDGGHVMFLLYEVVTGRKPSDKFMEYAQMIGMGLLIALLLYANGMDIVRLFK